MVVPTTALGNVSRPVARAACNPALRVEVRFDHEVLVGAQQVYWESILVANIFLRHSEMYQLVDVHSLFSDFVGI
jgi:hypothetical protein